MEYFSLLHLQKEPFSNSPDPEMFFQSAQHQGCLQKLEIAIRLKRGLSVVLGDIGTGKSTLCRHLIQGLTRQDDQIQPYLILDPEFTSPLEFLTAMLRTLGLGLPAEGGSEWQLKDIIKNQLFALTVEQHKVPVLIIDEGQKLPGFCVEILREFLNFETNQHKLLQIVIFAQEEFQSTLRQKANFADRITTFQRLQPLSFQDTWAMINFRLQKSHIDPGPPPRLFSVPAIIAIYCLTLGYPRRIVMLCSKVIIAILVSHRQQAGVWQVLRAAREVAATPLVELRGRGRWLRLVAAAALVAMGLAVLPNVVTSPPSVPSSLALRSQGPAPAPAALEPQVVSSSASPVALPPSPPPAVLTAPEPESLAAIAEVSLEPPAPSPRTESMGRLRVESGVTLSKMVARVYGRWDAKKMAAVLAQNPQIANADRLVPGTYVDFPLLAETRRRLPVGRRWLELLQTRDLAAAYAIMAQYPESAPPLIIEPEMGTGDGLVFHVLVEESFSDEAAAERRRPSLPPEWQARAQVTTATRAR